MSIPNTRPHRAVQRPVKSGGSSTTEHMPNAPQPSECTSMAHALYPSRCLLTSLPPSAQMPHHATLPALKTPLQHQLAGVLTVNPPHLPGARIQGLPLAGRRVKINALASSTCNPATSAGGQSRSAMERWNSGRAVNYVSLDLVPAIGPTRKALSFWLARPLSRTRTLRILLPWRLPYFLQSSFHLPSLRLANASVNTSPLPTPPHLPRPSPALASASGHQTGLPLLPWLASGIPSLPLPPPPSPLPPLLLTSAAKSRRLLPSREHLMHTPYCTRFPVAFVAHPPLLSYQVGHNT